ncbi:hypothetical protein LCGC14_1222650 [marine sediment metagenome]|uniref:Uncharacterized protein n=1 Tax=marine sediment metagenome TaxID=412755 RepID=A0A0F9LEU5_9ZZZZ|nr:hypothetical protein [bacterium]
MKNEIILKKAIEKAVENGWNEILFQASLLDRGRRKGLAITITDIYPIPYEAVIFSHDFAKAFWGEKEILVYFSHDDSETLQKSWRANLQKMVVEEEPLKYIARFLDGSNDSKN